MTDLANLSPEELDRLACDLAVVCAALKQALKDGNLEMYREFLQIQIENLRLRWEAKRLQATRRELES